MQPGSLLLAVALGHSIELGIERRTIEPPTPGHDATDLLRVLDRFERIGIEQKQIRFEPSGHATELAFELEEARWLNRGCAVKV